MYSYIKGQITEIGTGTITIECQDIGYRVFVPNSFIYQINEELKVYLYQKIKEDAHELYGFKTCDERDMFIKLTSVKGLGPKGAMAILASSSVSEIVNNIEENNASFFLSFPGIGNKSSAQIILDLKGKLHFDINNNPSKSKNIIIVQDALKSLGYNNQEIKLATKDLNFDNNTSLSDLIKEALRKLKRN